LDFKLQPPEAALNSSPDQSGHRRIWPRRTAREFAIR
jgi:hypothetical protein